MYITGLTHVVAILLVYFLWNDPLCMQLCIFSFLLTGMGVDIAAERNSQIIAMYQKEINDFVFCNII